MYKRTGIARFVRWRPLPQKLQRSLPHRYTSYLSNHSIAAGTFAVTGTVLFALYGQDCFYRNFAGVERHWLNNIVHAESSGLDLSDSDSAHELEIDEVAQRQKDLLAGRSADLRRQLEWLNNALDVIAKADTYYGLRVDFASLPSNAFNEDTMVDNVCEVRDAIGNNFLATLHGWGIFDGHAGPYTSRVLALSLVEAVLRHLSNLSFTSTGDEIEAKITEVFETVDQILLQQARGFASGNNSVPKLDFAGTQSLAASQSGSCALIAVFDPRQDILHVANTGDSRAVLGRYEYTSGHYIAQPLSTDHTGFNKAEVARIDSEHPASERGKIVDPETGRVHGIAVTRAFGDARWKLKDEELETIHRHMWGYSPRPNGVNKTPPYLKATPEIKSTHIKRGRKGDFLILASDGFWDNVSNEHAVLCVEQWLEASKKGSLLKHRKEIRETQDEEVYYDEKEKSQRWRVEPKHFAFEDDNVAQCLIRNAFGGNRRNLLCAVTSAEPPMSRSIRDDTTVLVVFFGEQ